MRTAVLGTGLMGAGMARSLSRDGHDVIAWNRTRARAEPLADDGVRIADSVSDAVDGADAVITMLFDVDATLAVSGELTAALGPDAVWIQAGTVGPAGARRIAEAAPGVLLDAPVLGTKKPADEGKLVVLVSGPDSLIKRVQPVFDAIGGKTIVVGAEIGEASALKLACNAWVGLITAGTAQSIAIADHLGVDGALFLQAIEGGPVDSAYAQLKGRSMLDGDFSPSFALDGVLKDYELMLAAVADPAAVDGAAFPRLLLAAVHDLFEQASADGYGADDMAAVRKAFPPK